MNLYLKSFKILTLQQQMKQQQFCVITQMIANPQNEMIMMYFVYSSQRFREFQQELKDFEDLTRFHESMQPNLLDIENVDERYLYNALDLIPLTFSRVFSQTMLALQFLFNNSNDFLQYVRTSLYQIAQVGVPSQQYLIRLYLHGRFKSQRNFILSKEKTQALNQFYQMNLVEILRCHSQLIQDRIILARNFSWFSVDQFDDLESHLELILCAQNQLNPYIQLTLMQKFIHMSPENLAPFIGQIFINLSNLMILKEIEYAVKNLTVTILMKLFINFNYQQGLMVKEQQFIDNNECISQSPSISLNVSSQEINANSKLLLKTFVSSMYGQQNIEQILDILNRLLTILLKSYHDDFIKQLIIVVFPRLFELEHASSEAIKEYYVIHQLLANILQFAQDFSIITNGLNNELFQMLNFVGLCSQRQAGRLVIKFINELKNRAALVTSEVCYQLLQYLSGTIQVDDYQLPEITGNLCGIFAISKQFKFENIDQIAFEINKLQLGQLALTLMFRVESPGLVLDFIQKVRGSLGKYSVAAIIRFLSLIKFELNAEQQFVIQKLVSVLSPDAFLLFAYEFAGLSKQFESYKFFELIQSMENVHNLSLIQRLQLQVIGVCVKSQTQKVGEEVTAIIEQINESEGQLIQQLICNLNLDFVDEKVKNKLNLGKVEAKCLGLK